jgi:hypothetical protein
MTFEELLADARATNINFHQYDRVLRTENCSLRVAVKRKSCRGRVWFEKGENVLVCGSVRADGHVTVWSSTAHFCLVQESLLRTV